MMNIPIVDLSPLLHDNDMNGIKLVAKQIGDACRGIGFFYAIGHGVDPILRKDVFAKSKLFFDSSDIFKRKSIFSAETGNRGYIPMKGESLDPSKPPDLKEAFNIGLEMSPDHPEILAGVPFRALNLWPEIPGFRDTMLNYFNTIWKLGLLVHKAIATDLGIDPNFFQDKLDRPLAALRLLHYPSRPQTMDPGQLGAGAHSDYGCMTFLASDEVNGLQVCTRDGEWLNAPYIPDSFVCNIGDCLMRWTNDIYVSTPHRVISPPECERYSVAFFLDPNPDAIVECLPGCDTETNPAKYPPIRGDAYLQNRIDATYKKNGLLG